MREETKTGIGNKAEGGKAKRDRVSRIGQFSVKKGTNNFGRKVTIGFGVDIVAVHDPFGYFLVVGHQNLGAVLEGRGIRFQTRKRDWDPLPHHDQEKVGMGLVHGMHCLSGPPGALGNPPAQPNPDRRRYRTGCPSFGR